MYANISCLLSAVMICFYPPSDLFTKEKVRKKIVTNQAIRYDRNDFVGKI